MLSLQSDQEIRHTIGLFGPTFQPDQWPPASVHFGFSGAEVYKFTARNKNYALRIWPSIERSLPKLEALTRLLEDVYAEGITYVAPAIRKTDGTVATISSSGKLIHIEPWLPGEPLTTIALSAQRLKNTMRAVAHLHLAAAKHMPSTEHFSWIRPAHEGKSPSLKHRLGKLEYYLNTGVADVQSSLMQPEELRSLQLRLQLIFRSRAANLWEELKTATQLSLPLQPVFKDLWREHVLFTEDEVSGVIDPAAFGTDSVLTDITRLLGSIAGNNWKLWSDAVNIYQAVRPLNQTEQKLIAVFDYSNLLLSAIGCFENCLKTSLLNNDFSRNRQSRLSARLEEYLNRLESYQ